MKEEEKILLFFKELRSRLLPGESKGLPSRYDADPGGEPFAREVEGIWEASGRYKSRYQPDVDAGFQRLQRRMEAAEKTSSVRPRRWMMAAAAAALLIIAAWWWHDSFRSGQLPGTVVVSSEGGQRSVELPDGSRVLLNQSSTISYPAVMDGQPVRALTLTGEAYFDVVPDPRQPFRITTGRATVEVLGTSFNVRAYPGEPTTEVEVESGRVRFSDLEGQESLTLDANARGTLGPSGAMQVTPAPQLPAHAWRTGTLRLRSIPLQEGLKAMERFFGVTLQLENAELFAGCQLTLGNFQRRELPEALVVLETNFDFKIEAADSTRYILSGGACPQ